MSAATLAASLRAGASRGPRPTTLLALVRAICEVTDDEREVVATVRHMLEGGEVRLCGILRDRPIEELLK